MLSSRTPFSPTSWVLMTVPPTSVVQWHLQNASILMPEQQVQEGPRLGNNIHSSCPHLLISWELSFQDPKTASWAIKVFTAGWGRRAGCAEWSLRQGGQDAPCLPHKLRPTPWKCGRGREITSVTDAAEVAGPLAVFLQVVCHVCCS